MVFEKRRFQNASVHTKQKGRIFKFLRFEERQFEIKAAFSWQISVDGRPKHKNKHALSNFYSIVWTGI